MSNIQVKAKNRNEMLRIWEKMTKDNLSEVQIKTEKGLTVGIYRDLILVSETSVVLSDDSVFTTYMLREKTDTEKRLDALESGQQIQDGALIDLGEITSALADQKGDAL